MLFALGQDKAAAVDVADGVAVDELGCTLYTSALMAATKVAEPGLKVSAEADLR